MHELMYTMYVQILLLRHAGLFICYRILMCSLDSFSLFIFIHSGTLWVCVGMEPMIAEH